MEKDENLKGEADKDRLIQNIASTIASLVNAFNVIEDPKQKMHLLQV